MAAAVSDATGLVWGLGGHGHVIGSARRQRRGKDKGTVDVNVQIVKAVVLQDEAGAPKAGDVPANIDRIGQIDTGDSHGGDSGVRHLAAAVCDATGLVCGLGEHGHVIGSARRQRRGKDKGTVDVNVQIVKAVVLQDEAGAPKAGDVPANIDRIGRDGFFYGSHCDIRVEITGIGVIHHRHPHNVPIGHLIHVGYYLPGIDLAITKVPKVLRDGATGTGRVEGHFFTGRSLVRPAGIGHHLRLGRTGSHQQAQHQGPSQKSRSESTIPVKGYRG